MNYKSYFEEVYFDAEKVYNFLLNEKKCYSGKWSNVIISLNIHINMCTHIYKFTNIWKNIKQISAVVFLA